jgi:hypothetical protein
MELLTKTTPLSELALAALWSHKALWEDCRVYIATPGGEVEGRWVGVEDNGDIVGVILDNHQVTGTVANDPELSNENLMTIPVKNVLLFVI